MTRHEIQILRAVGMAQTASAATPGVSVRSVRRIEDEPAVSSSDTAALIRARGVGRPSLAAPWAPTVERWLQEDRTVPSGEIIRRLREDHGYRGGKSAVYELIRRLRPVSVAPLVRFEGVPGEFSQHDFGMVSVRYVTGVVERVRFFASRLKWSRFVDVTLVPDEREEALIRGLLHALEAFRGVPLVTVWDNPKTVVLARKGALIVWNPVFGQVALDYRFAPELCWPRAGQQKGAVENLVGWVKKSFFTCRRFHDRADLEQQLRDWLRMVNTERPNRATGIIPAVRLAEEQRRLRPLPIAADAYALKYAVVVSARARVSHAGHEYSMPPAAIGQAATLHLYEERVEILTKTGAGRCRACPRGPPHDGRGARPGPRWTAPPAALADRAAALSRARPPRRRREPGLPRVPRRAHGRGSRPSGADADSTLRASRPLSFPQDGRRVRLHLPVGRPPLAARQRPQRRLHHSGPVAHLQRAERHGEDAPGDRHRLPRDPERLRRSLHHRDGAHRRSLGGDTREQAPPGPAHLHAPGRARDRRGRLSRLRPGSRQCPLPGRQRPLPAPTAHDLHDEQAARRLGARPARRRPRRSYPRPRARTRPPPRTARALLPNAPRAP